jgi:SNF2 family DNA or RNA helicase
MNLRSPRHAMKKEQEIVRIELTPEQKELVKQETGKEGDAVELTVKELEERIAPRMMYQ